MNTPDAHDPNASVNTGGGGYVSGDVHAGGDVYLGAKNVGGDEVHGDKHFHQYVDWQSPPSGLHIPYGRNPLFTGREDELRKLANDLLPKEDLTGEGTPVRSGVSIISTGIGGVGKTQLAVEFAHRYHQFFHGVYWISMTDPDNISSEIAACGQEMGLALAFSTLPLPDQVAMTRRSWAGPEPRLLIFDNCEDAVLLDKWWPKTGGARMLVTSLNTIWPPEFTATTQPIYALPPLQSLLLLRKYLDLANRSEADEALGQVAAAVGDLPLALALAGHYLALYKRDSIEVYLDKLRSATDLMPIGRGAFSPTGHDLSVWRTFAVSYDRLQPDDAIDAAAIALLARAACFAPGEPLPEGLLLAAMEGAAGEKTNDGRQITDDGLLRLLELGLLERAGDDAFRLHRLIVRFAARALADEMDGARVMVEGAVNTLASQQNAAGDPRTLRDWEIHMRHVTDSAFDREDNTAATLCANMGYYLQMSGDMEAARPYLERALAINDRILGPDHPDTATSLNNMGALLQATGDYPAARPYYERALAVREHVLSPDHPDTAASLNNMGALLDSMGDLAAAQPYYERALGIWEHILGPDHPQTAAALNNLGYLLKTTGEHAAARPYYERALAINERVLGPNHPDTARSLNNLGSLLQETGDLATAQHYIKRALAIWEHVLGPDHPQTTVAINNLGSLLQDMDDLTAARPYYERVLAIRERILGPDHPATARSLNNMGFRCRRWATCPQHDHTSIVPWPYASVSSGPTTPIRCGASTV